MTKKPLESASAFLPESRTLPALKAAAADCEGCELFRDATQTVFGLGPAQAAIMLVGETPGDREDRQGEPFVGPAGKLLDQVLAEIGLKREQVYVTNAVKHFRFEERGPRRLHKKPTDRQVRACHPWLEAEIESVNPRVIVCLGATAAQSLLGATFRITKSRGRVMNRAGYAPIIATYHPAAILRAPDAAVRKRMGEEFVSDLRAAAGLVE